MGDVCIVVPRPFHHVANPRRCLFIIAGTRMAGLCSRLATPTTIVYRIDSLTKHFVAISHFSIIVSAILKCAHTSETNHQKAYRYANNSHTGWLALSEAETLR